MKKLKLIILFLLSLFIFSCSTVPLTNRKQLALIPHSELLSMSFSQYDAFLDTVHLSTNQEEVDMVKRVGQHIAQAVFTYLTKHNRGDILDGFNWEFNLVESDQANAWCMPGGKVVVYTGILPITKDETGLAVVLGHEISHAIADHGNERMSQALIQQYGGAALSMALQNKPQETRNLWLTAYGVGTYYGAMLPYSRLQESEADHLGLIFMAIAGYNPEGAIAFWQRMAAASQGQKPPEFMSTHPSDETRIKHLEEWMPDALKYYNASEKGGNNSGKGSGQKKKGNVVRIGG